MRAKWYKSTGVEVRIPFEPIALLERFIVNLVYLSNNGATFHSLNTGEAPKREHTVPFDLSASDKLAVTEKVVVGLVST
jgi:hypothetical protein